MEKIIDTTIDFVNFKNAVLNRTCGYSHERVIKEEYRNHAYEDKLYYEMCAIYRDDQYRESCVIPNFDKKFKELVETFVKTMEANFDKEDLQNMYRNIEFLDIKFYNKFIKLFSKDRNYLGTYTPENLIKLKKEVYEDVIFHELLHMSSAKVDQDGTYSSGFKRAYNGTILGTYLNEGYTDLLNKRLFKKDVSYDYEVLIAEALEKIIGREKMQKLYLNGDSVGLITELEQYTTLKNIILFDYALSVLRRKNLSGENIDHFRKQVVLFLLIVFINKYQDNELFLEDYSNYIEYLNSLFFTVKNRNGEKSITLMSEQITEDLIDLSELGIKKDLKKTS